jgi:hypothetical protein
VRLTSVNASGISADLPLRSRQFSALPGSSRADVARLGLLSVARPGTLLTRYRRFLLRRGQRRLTTRARAIAAEVRNNWPGGKGSQPRPWVILRGHVRPVLAPEY